MTKFYIKTKKTYEKNGQEITRWLDVGTLTQFDDGGLALELRPGRQTDREPANETALPTTGGNDEAPDGNVGCPF